MFERPEARRPRAARRARHAATTTARFACRNSRRSRRPPAPSSSAPSPAAAQRPDPAFFAGSGKVDEIAARRTRSRRRPRDLRPHAVRRAAAQPRAEARVPRRRPRRASSSTSSRCARAAPKASCRSSWRSLKHMSTRLVGGWTHLERQKGGIGLRGPGETQLETDRRLIGERVKLLQRAPRARRAQPRRAKPHAPPRATCAPSRWSATPTPASRRCSTG